LTLLLTDMVGSTRLWEQDPRAMSEGVARHNDLVEQLVERHGGFLPRQGEGDSSLSVFRRASDAVACALAFQLSIVSEPWETGEPIRVRMALHSGEPEVRGETYLGPVPNRCARLRSMAKGGQILLSQATYELVRDHLPEGATVVDLGVHRLRDVSRPEHIYQLAHRNLPFDFAPLPMVDAVPNNLPEQLTTFIGRTGELDEVARLLRSVRMVTLTGAGGCGKTRMALQASSVVAEDFPDGVWLVELAPVSDPLLVPTTLAAVLGLREQAGKPLTETIAEGLRARRTLLVFDNAEHLTDSCAAIAHLLLRQVPGLTVLTTSREPLGITGEVIYRVPSLTVPAPHSPLEKLTEFESVNLFLDRARRVAGSFALTESNASAVAEICRRLDGIPLALELAAARVPMMRAEQIRDRLGDAFTLLTGGSRAALPRQQTLRAAIDWGYKLADEAERRTFNRLSIFAGTFSLDAAHHVAGEGVTEAEFLTWLSRLVDKSFLSAEHEEFEARYSLLETLRHYGAEKLAADGETAPTRKLHLGYFLDLAESAEEPLLGPEQGRWLDRLEADHDNLRAAAAWSLEQGSFEVAQRLASALSRYWEIRGHLSEGGRFLEAALAGSSPPAVRAKALRSASRLGLFRGDYNQARLYAEESLRIDESLGDAKGRARSIQSLANVSLARGDYGEAESLYRDALGIQRGSGDDRGAAVTLANLGVVAWGRGDYPEAEGLYQQALEIQRGMGDMRGVAASLNNLGVLMQTQGKLADARSLFEEALEYQRKVGDRRGIAAALGNLGNIAHNLGDFESAHRLYEEALEIQRDLAEKHGCAESLVNLGNVSRDLGNLALARERLEEGLVVAREIEEKKAMAAALTGLGDLARSEQRLSDAEPLLAEALRLHHELGDRRGIVDDLESIALIATTRGEHAVAARLLGAAEAAREEIGAPIPPSQQGSYEDGVHDIRRALGAEFENAWKSGRDTSLEDAVNLSLRGL